MLYFEMAHNAVEQKDGVKLLLPTYQILLLPSFVNMDGRFLVAGRGAASI